MRIGDWHGGAALGALLVAVSAVTATARGEVARPVPLGGSLSDQEQERTFVVYVPTRFGGVLTATATDGEIIPIAGPDRRPWVNGEEVGMNRHGWYFFKVRGAEGRYAVETTFVQVGAATRMPWNYYYWPTKSDAIHEPWSGWNGRVDTPGPVGDDELVVPFGSPVAPGQDIVRAGPNGILETTPAPGDDVTWFPNLYDNLYFQNYSTPAPMLKYDQLFSTSARSWEAAATQNHDIQRWPGHCLGGAVASIMLAEPVPSPGSGLTADELKGLWAELGENHYNHRIGDNANNIPAGPPRPGWDPTDGSVPRFHAMLETHLRGRRKALLANLRAYPPSGGPGEVWNHGVGKYTAVFHAIPGRGERAVRLEVEVIGNSGANLNNSDPKPRINTYEYSLVYGLDGTVDERSAGTSDWIAVGGDAMYCPLNLMEVVESRWQGHNPYVTEANVRAVDLANGGGLGGRFAGSAPTFRPASGADGRGAFAFGNPGPDGPISDGAPPRRGGLFGLFRGR